MSLAIAGGSTIYSAFNLFEYLYLGLPSKMAELESIKANAIIQKANANAVTKGQSVRKLDEQRALLHKHMADPQKASFDFDLEPKKTTVWNESFLQDIENTVCVPDGSVKILCVPPQYGKTYGMCRKLRELIESGKLAGADFIRSYEDLGTGESMEAWLTRNLALRRNISTWSTTLSRNRAQSHTRLFLTQ